MKTKHALTLLLLFFIFYGCKKSKQQPSCVSLTNIEYQWYNNFTVIEHYTGTNTITSTQIINPIGYFSLNTNGGYNVNSNGVPLSGIWEINSSNCMLRLDKGSSIERSFSIDLITNDSLTISRTDTLNKIIYKQHYSKKQNLPTCTNVSSIEYQWFNNYIIIQHYTGINSITSTQTIIPVGYFTLNSNATYNVYSNNVPLNGSWEINPTNCYLTLDKGSLNERSFSIDLITNDSLTISRKDTINKIIYKQHYSKKQNLPTCINVQSIEYQWNNSYILEQFYNGNTIINSQIIYPVGYFTLNANGIYNVFSNGVPLNGIWEINPNTCKLTLDKGGLSERSFSIDLVTNDSLIISRKDTLNQVVYKQHYVKNH